MIELRRAGPADAATVRHLTREAYAKWVPIVGREPKPMGADYDAAVRNHRVDLLYVGGTLAALIEMIDQGDRLLVENLAVSPGYQRRGLGTRLLAHAEAVAASLGYGRHLALHKHPDFDGNAELYARVGYRIDSEEDIGGGLVRINMSKTVAIAAK